uniref:Cadherin domain-containing protein n=1 Tax=Anser cygnoides TaxID=8845 RepID=A0A8B9EKV8_ANSCY
PVPLWGSPQSGGVVAGGPGYQASVAENRPAGTAVARLTAVDPDAGEAGRLHYTGTGFPFAINNSTGWIVVASELDREVVDFYSFGVEAQDQGSPPMASSASVSVTILDVNDNSPEFTQREYGARLNEDAVVGTSVLTVSAVDRDASSAPCAAWTGRTCRSTPCGRTLSTRACQPGGRRWRSR